MLHEIVRGKKGIKPLIFPGLSQQCIQYTSFNLSLSNGHGCISSAQAARIRNICLGVLMTGTSSLLCFGGLSGILSSCLFLEEREWGPGLLLQRQLHRMTYSSMNHTPTHPPGLRCVCNGWNNFPHLAAERN